MSLRPFLHAAIVGIVFASATLVRSEVQVERVFMPLGAAPSSFAIGLSGGVNFCFDPVRGGVSYVWKGGFVDLTPARPGPGKFIRPVKLLGTLMYQESGFAPLRRGNPARVPVMEFVGYTLRDDAVEFRYTVDGHLVREEIRASADGATLLRRFRFAEAADATWWHVVEGQTATELRREADGTFLLALPLRGKGSP